MSTELLKKCREFK